MTLPVIWAFCSLPLAWLSARKQLLTVMIAALGILAVALLVDAGRGIAFEPIGRFSPIFNVRVGGMLVVLASLIALRKLIAARTVGWDWFPQVLNIIQITTAIFLLLLLTGETRDYFEQQIAQLPAGSEESESTDIVGRLHNLQQLSLSGVWLFYSVGLMAIGIWRTVRSFRIVAFVLFGITILKIFIYDLSFLETLYRIFSFVGLGVILLGVSYVYQRYKDAIFGSASTVTN